MNIADGQHGQVEHAGAQSTSRVASGTSTAPSENDSKPGGPLYVARAAVVLLCIDVADAPDYVSPEMREFARQVDTSLRDALSSDARVTQVFDEDAVFDVANARVLTFSELDNEALLAESIAPQQVLRLNRAITFQVRIPKKNQPRYRDLDDVPSDEYLVIWDGVVALVQWDQPDQTATGSGGHVVFDILQDVVQRAGHSVNVIACSPGCFHRFTHCDFVTFEDYAPGRFRKGGRLPVGDTVITPFKRHEDPLENIRRTYSAIANVYHAYAHTKNLGDSIKFLEGKSQEDAQIIMGIAYAKAARPRLFRRYWIKRRWEQRGTTALSRTLTSGLWVALIDAEARSRAWIAYNNDFLEELRNRRMKLMKAYLDTGDQHIQSMDLGLIQSALQEMRDRTEAKRMVVATALGAVAALAGAAVTALIGG